MLGLVRRALAGEVQHSRCLRCPFSGHQSTVHGPDPPATRSHVFTAARGRWGRHRGSAAGEVAASSSQGAGSPGPSAAPSCPSSPADKGWACERRAGWRPAPRGVHPWPQLPSRGGAGVSRQRRRAAGALRGRGR